MRKRKGPKSIGIDMDDCIADYWKATRNVTNGKVQEHLMWNTSFFKDLDPISGSKGAIFELEKMGFDLWIVTQPLTTCPESYTDKALWIQMHFPHLYNKIIMTQHKGMILTDFLIDDNAEKWKEKFERNGGKFIHFPYGGYNYANAWALCPDPEKSWREIVEFFRKENSNR